VLLMWGWVGAERVLGIKPRTLLTMLHPQPMSVHILSNKNISFFSFVFGMTGV
jgi:hypothetical protein